ncbi:MAG: hypothetical protein QOD83_361 [Solirubrobacteraceae bacterium]|jgi:hypothetical protein|nr:hypothetical protein [Solirubrobacteraceae bacterium]
MFARDKLTLGVFFAIESYSGDTPTMQGRIDLAWAARGRRLRWAVGA